MPGGRRRPSRRNRQLRRSKALFRLDTCTRSIPGCPLPFRCGHSRTPSRWSRHRVDLWKPRPLPRRSPLDDSNPPAGQEDSRNWGSAALDGLGRRPALPPTGKSIPESGRWRLVAPQFDGIPSPPRRVTELGSGTSAGLSTALSPLIQYNQRSKGTCERVRQLVDIDTCPDRSKSDAERAA